MTDKLPLTHSAIQKAKTCWRAYEFAYEMQIRPIRSREPLTNGATFHLALEVFDKTEGSFEDKKQAGLDAIYNERRVFPSWCVSDDDRYLYTCHGVRCAVMFGCHCDYYRNDSFHVVATELSFQVPILNPNNGSASRLFEQAGKIDRIVKLPDGRYAVQEYKTTSDEIEPTSDYWKRLRIDSQISTYILAARARNIPAETVIYDVTRWVALRPHRATPVESRKYKADGTLYANQRAEDETPEAYGLRCYQAVASNPGYYFRREEIARLEFDLREHQHDVWAMQKMIRQAQQSGRFPRNTNACKNWYGRCEYFDVCTSGCTIDPMHPPEGFERLSTRNPELTPNP